MSNRLLTTTEVALIAGVGASSVKRWADDGVLPVVRTAGGHRRFDRSALDRFLRTSATTDEDPWVTHLVGARRHEVEAALLESRARLGAWYMVADEVAAALAELGAYWEAGRITIAQEHVASECLLRALANAIDAMPSRPGARTCLVACADGDEHTLPLALAELVLREAGWATLWLGRQTPPNEIAQSVLAGGVDMVALSACAAFRDRDKLASIAREVGGACKQRGAALAIGGRGPWPDQLEYGERLASFSALRDYLDSRD